MKQLETDGAIVSAVDQVHIMVGKFDYRSDLALVAPPLDWTDGVNADETRGITNLQSFFFLPSLPQCHHRVSFPTRWKDGDMR